MACRNKLKRAALQKPAAAASMVAEDYARKFESGDMVKVLHSPFRSIKPQYFTPTSSFTSFSDSSFSDFNVSNEISVLINSVHPIGPALRKLVPFINREIVVSILKSQAELKKDPRISFRFFIWASGKRQLQCGVLYNLMVDLLSCGDNENSFDLYWSVLDELRDAKLSISANAFVVLISGYWRLRNAEKAVETFGRMKDYGCKPNLAACNMILNVLVKKGVILLALAVYNMMLKSNYIIRCDTFNVLIDGLCKSGMTKDALRLFDEMTDRGILPSAITYTVVISGLCKAKRTHDAHNLFVMMKNSGCKPDSAMYNALLDGFCKCGQIDEAFLLIKSFRDDGYNVGIRGYSCMIDGLIRVKRMCEAEKLFQKVFDAGLVPDLILYSIMIRGLSESGRVIDAMNMFRDMIGKGIVPDTQCYNMLIKGFCDIGLLDKAQSLKLEISQQDQFPNTCTYTILICGLCRNGLLGEAQQIFNDMEKLGCSPSVVTFNALIDGLCKVGMLDEAHLMLYKMEIGKNPSLFLRLSQSADPVLDSASLQKMVDSLVSSGLILKAYKLLMQLVDSGVVPDIITYNTLINGMCRAGQVNRALKLFEELQMKGRFPDSITYSTLIEGLQRVGREGDAYRLFEQMSENGCKPCSSVYKTLLTWSCRRRNTSIAFSLWLKYLSSLAGREGEALKLTEELFRKGDLEKAVRSLLEMESELVDFDSAPYSIWLVGLCQANRIEEALKTFSILEEFNVVVSAPGCVKLINALCARGNLNEAVDVFLYTMEKGYRLMPRVCNNLLQALLDSKDNAVLAFELVDKMKAVGYDLSSNLQSRTKSLLHHHYSARKMENVSAL
ncbi:pentatricopeptide repeat-containing protein at1g79540 [Phtheirospermum japonicum]|uniref:Pentatricopeptide repeat-containing protein at1g79540 n=1 Tax=Phtheirospermum japonicum TaxID=374723 RepID=A0A830AY17_9LAMI|nr:pentatricopeptide repeat-containing protein at1g79540 [Phtheirospermum japonicum]